MPMQPQPANDGQTSSAWTARVDESEANAVAVERVWRGRVVPGPWRDELPRSGLTEDDSWVHQLFR